MTEIERLKRIAIDLKVELNMRDAKISELERQLASSRQPATVRQLTPNTRTMSKAESLCEGDEDNGQEPMASGQYRNPFMSD